MKSQMSQRNKTKVTVRFSKRLRDEMNTCIVNHGYGLHGKSKWISEAIQKFINRIDFIELVEHGQNINQGDLVSVEAFYIDESTKRLLEQAIVKVRIKHPLFEGVQSAIIRASVINSLI